MSSVIPQLGSGKGLSSSKLQSSDQNYAIYLTAIHKLKFMKKVVYAREGARSMMDLTFADFPWHLRKLQVPFGFTVL
ncbi:hypothetical protein T459_33840 [Capsicum annuum]|uniref:Uncharacterized protein n=1 Tax=Capsicum annuum TaxID=4072 RepID=A0A2G2XXR8_CAPAN|nr:hypothetical protein T459_33840 [Capsicum annuum]